MSIPLQITNRGTYVSLFRPLSSPTSTAVLPATTRPPQGRWSELETLICTNEIDN